MMRSRLLGLVLAVALVAPVPAQAAPAPSTSAASSANAAAVDAIRINGGAYATNIPTVSVSIAPPASAASLTRLSNDGVTWIGFPYQASVAWSLIDPAAGGSDVDGHKTVHVQYGLDGAWSDAGAALIYLDRVAPAGTIALQGGASSMASWAFTFDGPLDELSGVGGYRLSLDGSTWSGWNPERYDWRTIDHGGSWALGTRTLLVQMRDLAGNVSEVMADSIELTQPPLNPDEGTVPVRFEFPLAPVTGSPFTVRPVYPAGFTMPSNAWCSWYFHWGDDESLYGPPNEHYGELAFERKASTGGCGEWTFTLPYNAGRRFNLQFALLTKSPAQVDDWGAGTALYANQTWKVLEFTAAIGTTDRHIRQSTIPVVYLLPESTLTQKGDSVTYRLHASGGLAVPQTGMFWTYPIECYINPQWSKTGGTSFTYTPNCNGNWVTGWTGTYKGGFMRSQYDPVVDGQAPTHNAPSVKLTKATVGSTAPVTVSWSGRDKHGSVYQWQLQRSTNGGAWTSLALPSRLTTSLRTSVAVTGTVRYRVRARDTVGNWSAWKYGATVSARAYQENYRYVRWTGAWANQTSTAWMGGAARGTTAAGASSSLSFDGRSVAWVARTGPTRGLVRVWIDGAVAATIDLRSAGVGTRSVQFATSWSAIGRHLIRIENLGTGGSPGADVDAFLIVR